jgi:hypothetical protein
MTTKPPGIVIRKLDAARNQLKTAITMWFNEGDPVSIHTLACAAYEIIHHISKKKNRPKPLIYDTDHIKDEYRKKWEALIKNPANFFKHASTDPDATIEFHPPVSELFILYSVLGVSFCGEKQNDEESAFMFWRYFHHPRSMTPEGRERLMKLFPVGGVEKIRALPRDQFLKAFMLARRANTRLRAI